MKAFGLADGPDLIEEMQDVTDLCKASSYIAHMCRHFVNNTADDGDDSNVKSKESMETHDVTFSDVLEKFPHAITNKAITDTLRD